jgi:SAM-dependent methyltransferase
MARDTDLDWQTIAEHQPFFGVLANEQYLAHNLSPGRIGEFYATGVADIEHAASTLNRLSGGGFAPRSAVDFGCGVGRLTLAMARHATRVVGVDVAGRMLEIGRKQAEEQRVPNVEFTSGLPVSHVDWVNSLIVLQHIPPARGHRIFEQLVDLVAPGGFLSIQLTFFRDKRHVAELSRDIDTYRYDGERIELLSDPATDEPGAMSMFDYDLNKVFRSLFLGGFGNVWCEHTDHGGCHGIHLFGTKR